MPAARYAPLPNPHTDPHAQNEMEAAFLDSDDELDEEEDEQPQTGRGRDGYHSLPHSDPLASPTSPSSPSPLSTHDARARTDGTYDFENVDYDADWTLRPPPGPPPPAAESLRSVRESRGNSNGMVPDFSEAAQQFARRARRGGVGAGRWLRRVVPEGVADRLGLAEEEGASGGGGRAVGGGMMNDGVFANVTAKPSRGVRVQEGEWLFVGFVCCQKRRALCVFGLREPSIRICVLCLSSSLLVASSILYRHTSKLT